MLAASLITLGSPAQLTGGYLYHQRLVDAGPDNGFSLRFLSVPMWPFPTAALSGAAILRRAAKADVVVVDSIAAAFVGPAAALRRSARPLVAMVHQPPGGIDHGPGRAAVQAVLDKALYRRADLVIAASEALAEEFAAAGFGGSNLRVVAPGADLAEPPSGPLPELRNGRRAAFLSVGNWVARKGTVALLEAFRQLPDDAATLHLVGRHDVEPGYAARVRALLQAPELQGRVMVHGPLPRPQVTALYRAADAFVLPSEREPYGTVYGEALAVGLPVVGWRAGNLPHLARDGEEGVILAPGDVDGLARALERLTTDDAWRDKLAEGARRRGASLPTWAASAARFFGLLREVVDRRAGAAH